MSDKKAMLDAVEIRRLAEEKLEETKGASLPSDEADTRKLIQELRVHQIELEMQGDELRAAQRDLEASRGNYQDLFDNAPLGYCTLDENGIILQANLTAARLLGMERSALVNKPITRFILRDDQDIYHIHMQKSPDAKEAEPCDLRMVKKDGSAFWANLTTHADQDREGVPQCRVALGDISERRQVEDAIKQQSQFLECLLENIPSPVFYKDGNGRYLGCNVAFESLVGRTRRDIIGKAVHEVWPEPFADKYQDKDLELIKNPGKQQYEFQIPSGDGAVRDVVYTNSTFTNLDGTVGGIIGLVQDITERKRSEEKLSKTQSLLRDTEEAAKIGGWEFDAQTMEQTWTEQLFRILEIDVSAGAPDVPEGLHFIAPSYRPMAEVAIQKAVELGEPYDQEWEAITALGNWRWVHSIAKAIKEDGKVTSVRGSFQDITQRKLAEEDFETIFNVSLDLICVASIETNTFLKINPAFCQLLGYSEVELLGRPFLDFVHPDDVEPTQRVVEEQLRLGRKVLHFENRYRTSKGEYRWLDWNSHPVPEKGVTFAMARDVTEKKQDAHELERSERLLKITGGIAQVGGWEYDLRTMTPYLTSEALHIFELQPGNALPVEEGITFYHPDDQEKVRDAFERAVEHGEPYDLEVRFISAKGTHKWIKTICSPQLADGKVVRLFGSIQDISQRKQSEETLIESERRLRAVLDATPFPVAVVDPNDEEVFFWSKSAVDIFGHTAPTASEWYELAYPDPVYRQEVVERWKHSLEIARDSARPTNCGEYRITCADGSERICELWATFIRDRLIVTLNDITQQIQSEEEKRELESRLHQSKKMESIGRLAGGVAHDFNNLLTIITGNISLAMEELQPDDPLTTTLREVSYAADSAAGLTRQLLAFSSKQVIDPRILNLNELVENIRSMLAPIIGEDMDLQTRPAKDLWSIKADQGQLEQIIMNLTINARDAMPDGGKLTIGTGNVSLDEHYCQRHLDSKPGDYVMLSVSDDGKGMDEVTQSKIFDPFFSTKSTTGGTGLGLATTFGIVIQHKGFIEVISKVGQGSTFKIFLPRVERGTDPEIRETETGDGQKGAEIILLVEDSEMVLKIATRALKEQGYTVYGAESGPLAIKLLEENNLEIDLLMTDIVMPEMNGRELAEKLQLRYPGLKVLYTSGYTEDVITHHGVLDEGIEFIGKPFTPKTLSAKIREVLNKGAAKIVVKD